VFAAVAAAGFVPWVALVGPVAGGRRAVAVYLVLATATYLAGIAPSRRRAAGAAGLALLAGGALLVAAWSPVELAVGLGFVGGSGGLGVVLGLWAFFLVQSLWFLAGGGAARRAARHADPFDEACTRACAILDGDGLQ
jgi:hypothetical protein